MQGIASISCDYQNSIQSSLTMNNDIELPTAKQENELHLYLMWHDWVYGKGDEPGHYVECVVPDQQTAREFLAASRPFKGDVDGWPLYRHEYTEEQIVECKKKAAHFRQIHLDMRDQIVTADNGKVGLQDVTGKMIVPSIFDDIPERYTPDNRDLIPVVKDGSYCLYNYRHNSIKTEGYDCIFRYFGGYISYYVAQQDGKVGVLDCIGDLLVPVIMDEIYSMQDPDRCIPFIKDGKWGVAQLSIYVPPVFEHLEVWSEEYVRVWLNCQQGWVNHDGEFTTDINDACIGSWCDSSK